MQGSEEKKFPGVGWGGVGWGEFARGIRGL